jgi:hypothetical protein
MTMDTATTTAPRQSASKSVPVWPLALIAFACGIVAAIMGYWPGVHVIQTILGLISVTFAFIAQYFSTNVDQRWVAMIGGIGGGFGVLVGLFHGGI